MTQFFGREQQGSRDGCIAFRIDAADAQGKIGGFKRRSGLNDFNVRTITLAAMAICDQSQIDGRVPLTQDIVNNVTVTTDFRYTINLAPHASRGIEHHHNLAAFFWVLILCGLSQYNAAGSNKDAP
ncbi:hypothetical protein [Roseibium sp. MMSF_3544]|uniref:hypothetical protein n=1 Tax=unclassified Roseibium TaxID=2629323 RepID=UPI00273E5909|nr:hypothetical protein [Roseibium sp. MMSF_3544]